MMTTRMNRLLPLTGSFKVVNAGVVTIRKPEDLRSCVLSTVDYSPGVSKDHHEWH